ncbi:MAG: hypothetical protein HOV87_24085 [Catenulispora sp.]|nr:hypothetical protein [Catenulispora sp.]
MITRSGARSWTARIALAAAAGMAATACGGGSSKGGAGGVWKGDPVAALSAADGPAAKAKTVHIEGDTADAGGARKLSGGIDFSTTVRADLTMMMSGSMVSDRARSEGDIRFTDWGKPVRMAIPDPSDVKVVETTD